MRKSTRAEVELRIREICKLLIKGSSREEIVQYSSTNWGVSERQADKYLKGAKQVIAKSVQKSIDYDFAKAVSRYEELYRVCMEKKDYKTALSVNKELSSLQGLLKMQVEHSGNVQFICDLP